MNISDAEEKKEEWYEELVNNCEEKDWETEYCHLAADMWIRRS